MIIVNDELNVAETTSSSLQITIKGITQILQFCEKNYYKIIVIVFDCNEHPSKIRKGDI